MHGFRCAPSTKTTLHAARSTLAAQPPSSLSLPPADSMPPLTELHVPRDAAASNGLGFEPWTAGLIPAGKRYSRKDVLESMFAPMEPLLHPNKQLTKTEPGHNSFAHLHMRD